MRTPARSLLLLPAFLLAASALKSGDAASLPCWKVAAPGGGTIYLMGSVHVGTPDMYPLAKEIEAAYAASAVVVVEADESKMDPVAMNKLVAEKGMCPPGETLFTHLSVPTREKVTAHLKKRGLPVELVQTQRPWMLSTLIAMTEIQSLAYQPALGIDRHFLQRAKKDGKPVEELESARFQIDLLAGLPNDLQEKMLLSALADAAETETNVKQMIAAWRTGDLKALHDCITHSMKGESSLKPLFDKIFDERNVGMARKAEAYLKSEKVHFIIAGAGHMSGEKGLVNLLRQRGFTVEQLHRADAK